MPRPARPKPNAIIASAAMVAAGRKKNRPQQAGTSWQDEAWNMLDVVGELEFYRLLISNAMSLVELDLVELVTGEDGKTIEQPVTAAATGEAKTAYLAMQALFGGDAGQAEMMAAMGGHLAIPGETWLVGLVTPSEDPTIDQWRVCSHNEVKEQGTKWIIDRGDGEPESYDATEVICTRIWRPHPRRWVEATSAVRAALPILRELVALSKMSASAIDSRLAGAGILAVPSEITFETPVQQSGADDAPDVDEFMVALTEAMTAAINDPGSPEALVPIVVKAPGEHLAKIKHITLSTPLQAEAREDRKEALERLANSLDLPAEMLTGLADVNHWTGWLADENMTKMHIDPPAKVIAGGIQTRYLWPCLQGSSATFDPRLRRFQLRTDNSRLRNRPNRSTEAQALHTSLTITDAALARETGFEDRDMLAHPDNAQEMKRRLLMQAARGVQTADVTVAALGELGVVLTPKPSEVADTGGAEGTAVGPGAPEPPAIESRRDLPDQADAPDQSPEQAAALLALSEVLTLRAVERGWNRAGKRGRTRQPVAAENLDAAMVGAWEAVDRGATLVGVDADRLRETLDLYARRLLTTGEAHDPHALAQLLTDRVLRQVT